MIQKIGLIDSGCDSSHPLLHHIVRGVDLTRDGDPQSWRSLGQCIEKRLDIVQIGVSTEQFSELVAQKITEARLSGIACITGAGNTGGAVQFPGNVPGVLTVSAVGKLGEYPQDTRHAQRALPQPIAFSGIYATNFSGWGPQVKIRISAQTGLARERFRAYYAKLVSVSTDMA